MLCSFSTVSLEDENSGPWESCFTVLYGSLCTMTYQHLGAPYESAVTDRHKFWLDKRDVAWQLEKRDSFNSSYFLNGKKGNWIGLELGGNILIFVAKSFVEGARSKSCRLIGCAEVLVGHSILNMFTVSIIEYSVNKLESQWGWSSHIALRYLQLL